ncbi:exosome-associated family protein [Moniliophthora roreri MCA 2997]|uniref:Exosome complex protein n=2 Tax=Moniliophthora roreri TaxID=221103 RepID=V2XTM6_MONRO|nr:exosome-associated family protein [Moniliophthora roreri MCA 2997]KAI3621999.1 exosome-associated family protein [Moniliophthora roreri]
MSASTSATTTAANETRKAKSRLANLSASLDELEGHLQPLLSKTLPETLLALEPLQQAKLLTDIPYLVYDLVFIYLKSRGVDPKTHPVVPELERVKSYFDKIKNAESPATRPTQIDKAAANRFIKHAISQAQSQVNQHSTPSTSTTEVPGSPSTTVPVKMTKKMIERAEYEKRLREEDDEGEDDGLEVYAGEERMEAEPANKRKRLAVDHFAGYGDPDPVSSTSNPASNPPKKLKTISDSTSVVSSPAPSTPTSEEPAKKKKKARKKKNKKAAAEDE